MNLLLVTPAPRGSHKGNRITALRWAKLLRGLGHRVTVSDRYVRGAHDALIALHLVKSHEAVREFHLAAPGRPIVVLLSGTDVYTGMLRDRRARESLSLATRLVALQKLAPRKLPSAARRKARVIEQSARPARGRKPRGQFVVSVVGHLRKVKDPFRAARAARALPATSRVQIRHAGAALDADSLGRARRELRLNARYRWLGDLRPAAARRLIASSHVMAITSLSEGGANVVSEAIASGVPVLASRVPGNVGLLGRSYAGYFPPGNERALARLIARAETEPGFLARLTRDVRALRPLVAPARERALWRKLLAELRTSSPRA